MSVWSATKTSLSIAGAVRISRTSSRSKRLSGYADRPTRTELPFHEDHSGCCRRRRCQQRGPEGKELWTENTSGEKIQYFEASDPDQEAGFVAEKVGEHRQNSPGTHIAVLYRVNFLSRVVEEMFRRLDIPYRVVGGFSFYERAEIKDLLSYLTAVLNLHDSVRLVRIINTPARGIGKTTVDRLLNLASEREISVWDAIGRVIDEAGLPLRSQRSLGAFRKMMKEFVESADKLSTAELLEQIVEKTGYEEVLEREDTTESSGRIDNIRELLSAAEESAERGESLRDFLDNAALVSDQDDYDETAPVTLMTLHTAKGLEFPTVFIIGWRRAVAPQPVDRRARVARRGASPFLCGHDPGRRAPLSHVIPLPAHIRHAGIDELGDLPVSPGDTPDLVDRLEKPEPLRFELRQRTAYAGSTYNTADAVQNFLELKGRVRSAKARAAGWIPGMRVKHPKYGFGTVLRMEGSGQDAKLTISFNNFGLKKIIAKYASLKVVSGA